MNEINVAMLSRQFRDGEPVSDHVKELSESLAAKSHEVCVFAFEDGSEYHVDDEVDVRRMPLHFDADNLYNWSMMLNNELKEGLMSWKDEKEIDVIHANDWATVPGAITVSRRLEVPLVVTIHSTENERGFGSESSGMISEMEWEAGFEADRVLVTNEDTRGSLVHDLDVPADKIRLIDPYRENWQEKVEKIYRSVSEMKQVAEV